MRMRAAAPAGLSSGRRASGTCDFPGGVCLSGLGVCRPGANRRLLANGVKAILERNVVS